MSEEKQMKILVPTFGTAFLETVIFIVYLIQFRNILLKLYPFFLEYTGPCYKKRKRTEKKRINFR